MTTLFSAHAFTPASIVHALDARARASARILAFGLLCIMLGGCALFSSERGDKPVEELSESSPADDAGIEGGPRGSLTRAELQTEVLLFADRLLEGVAEASDRAGRMTDDERAAAYFRETKVVYASSAIALAVLPEPDHALREFLVFLGLARDIWASDQVEQVSPAQRAYFLAELQKLDQDLERLASRVLSVETIEAVRTLALRWREANPQRNYIAFVRLADLLDQGDDLAEQARSGGLFAQLSEANRQLDEFRAIAERSLFIANRFPLLANWQGQSLADALLSRPSVDSTLTSLVDASSAVARLDEIMLAAFEQVEEERVNAIRQLSEVLATERSAAIAEAARAIGGERVALFEQLTGSTGELLPLAQALASSSSDLRETLELLDEMRGGEPLQTQIDDLILLTGTAEELASEVNRMLQSTQALLADERLAAGMAGVEQSVRAMELRLLAIGIILILTAGGVALGVIVLSRRLDRSV